MNYEQVAATWTLAVTLWESSIRYDARRTGFMKQPEVIREQWWDAAVALTDRKCQQLHAQSKE